MSEQLIRQNREFVDQILAPYIGRVRKQLESGWPDSEESPSYELACLLAQRHFQESLQNGTQIVFSEIPHLAHFHELEGDWIQFISRVQLIFGKLNKGEWIEDGESFWDSMQNALEISDPLMQAFYSLGELCYRQFETDRALAVMGLISLLNPMLFEPWLVQGMIHVQEKATEMSLFCLTMAAIVRFDHPAPHLLMARCYYRMGDEALAVRCSQLGADYIDSCGEPQWRSLLDQLQQEFRRGR